MTHLREMIFRKDFNSDEHNFFEVEFLDVTLILDDKIRDIVDTKI